MALALAFRSHLSPPLSPLPPNNQTKQPTAEDLDAAESASRPPSSLASSSQDLASATGSAGRGHGHGHHAALAGGGAAAAAVARQHLGAAVDRVTVEWQRLGCTYRVPGGTKVVLQDVWGIARPGEMQVREKRDESGARRRRRLVFAQQKKTHPLLIQTPPQPNQPPQPHN